MTDVPIILLAGQSNASLGGMDNHIVETLLASGGAFEFVKVAVAGTSIFPGSNPNWDPVVGTLLPQLISEAMTAAANVIAQGHTPRFYVLWVQGEGQQSVSQAQYADQLTLLINTLRDGIDQADASFAISMIPHDTVVRLAQFDVAATVADVTLIDPVNPGFYDFNTHYDRPTRYAIADSFLQGLNLTPVVDPAYVSLLPGAVIDQTATLDAVTATPFTDFTYAARNIVSQINGGFGDDRLTGGTQADIINGGDNNDVLGGGGGADRIDGGQHDDVVSGGAGNDILTGGNGIDVVYGEDGDDYIKGGRQNDQIFGGAGNDRLFGEWGDDLIDGGTGIDIVSYLTSPGGVTIRLAVSVQQDTIVSGIDTLRNIENVEGSNFADDLAGNTRANVIWGLNGNDLLTGFTGDDQLLGGAGADLLDGGVGRDIATGGTGADIFRYGGVDFAGLDAATADRITDFSRSEGDRIDVSRVDANATNSASDAFVFIGTAAFAGSAGQLRYEIVGGNTRVMGDINGDGNADFLIRVDGSLALLAADFVL